MKKHIFFFTAVACLSCLLGLNKANAQIFAQFAGNGTSWNPYQITNVTDLQNLSLIVCSGYGDSTSGRYFKLMNDINLQNIGWTPIGRLDYNDPLSYYFRGHFDGNGKVIRNLTCITGGNDITGLFHTLDGAIVENLGVENCNMTSNNTVGGLAGCSQRNTYISNCYVTGNIKGTKYTGGLVGYASSCTYISNCYFSGNVSAVGYSLGHSVGGLVGRYAGVCIGGENNNGFYHSIISNCYVTGKISAVDTANRYGYSVGGLIGGLADGIVRNCVVAVDSVTSNFNIAVNRIAGGAYFGSPPMYGAIGAILQNNYALNTMVVQDTNGNVPIIDNLNTEYGMSIPIDSLKSFTFYNTYNNWYGGAWSIYPPSGVWKICDKQDLPFLRWQGIDCYYDITAVAGSNGSITPLGTLSVVENTNQTFIFTPNTCYEVDSLWIDGVYAPDSIIVGSYTFKNITKNHTIKVSFKKIEYFTSIADTTCSDIPYLFGNHTLTSSGIYYNTLQDVNGCDSVIELTLTVNPAAFMSDSVTICEGDFYDFHGKTLSLADIYYDTLQTIHGCDSVFELVLTVNPLPEIPLITKTDNLLTSSIADSYQWYCNGVSILSATFQTYIYTENGKYSVEVTNEFGCTSISKEMDVNDVGIVETHCNASLRVYPNPTNNQLKIKNYEFKENEAIEIYNVVGQLMQKAPFNSPEEGKYSPPWKLSVAEVSEGLGEATIVLDISHLANGMYFLKVGNKTARFVKE